MSLTVVEYLAGVSLGDGAGGLGPMLSVLQSADQEYNVELNSVIPVGMTHPVYASVIGRNIAVPMQCGQIDDLLTAIGNMGANVSTTELFYRSIDNVGGPNPIDITATDVGAALHSVFRAGKVIAYFNQLSAGDRKQAFANIQLMCVKDGANEAMVLVGTTEHITRNPVGDDSYFSLGPIVYPGGKVLEGCDDFQLPFTPAAKELSSESNKDTEHASVRNIDPEITFTCTDRTAWNLRNTSAAGMKFHLVRGKNESDCYLPTEAQHIRLTIPKGLFVVEGKDSGDESRYSCKVKPVGDIADGWNGQVLNWAVNVPIDLT